MCALPSRPAPSSTRRSGGADRLWLTRVGSVAAPSAATAATAATAAASLSTPPLASAVGTTVGTVLGTAGAAGAAVGSAGAVSIGPDLPKAHVCRRCAPRHALHGAPPVCSSCWESLNTISRPFGVGRPNTALSWNYGP